MPDLKLERVFPVTPARLFQVVSKRSDLIQWWGPEGISVANEALDFTKTGPWFAQMIGSEGQQYKVSGQVTHVDPPHSVGFTWAWHDDQDNRGSESHVIFHVESCPQGAKLIIDHRDLADAEMAESHQVGWGSSMDSLAGYLAKNPAV